MERVWGWGGVPQGDWRSSGLACEFGVLRLKVNMR